MGGPPDRVTDHGLAATHSTCNKGTGAARIAQTHSEMEMAYREVAGVTQEAAETAVAAREAAGTVEEAREVEATVAEAAREAGVMAAAAKGWGQSRQGRACRRRG